MSTKAQLTERVHRILNGGSSSTNARVGKPEIEAQLSSALSSLFKTQVYETNYKIDGDSVPEGLLIARYENIPITRRDNQRCSATLPIAPMTLPKGSGVFSVYPSGYPEKRYIPLNAGLVGHMTVHKMLNPLCRKTYSVIGNTVEIHDDVVGAGVTELDMLLVCFDISRYGVGEPLPISADLEEQAIVKVCQIYGVEVPTTGGDNKMASPTKADTR